ncbi:MAG: class I SAM-dependent methyltransferase [Bacilli bacterium]
MQISNEWEDYEIINAGNGEKLERWGTIFLRRPDLQAMWSSNNDLWNKADGIYYRSDKGGGYWDFITVIPEFWTINYKQLTFKVCPTGFKHTGLFPEQAINWDFMINKIKNSNRQVKVLNLFAYTGGATMACLSAGASVTHVDASKGMVQWAKENAKLSKLENSDVRYIIDDCLKFVEREARRGNTYDAIIMDPPSYGRGPNGELWKIEDNLSLLINSCQKILSAKPLFFLINSYTTGISSTTLYNILKTTIEVKYKGKIEHGEIGLSVKNEKLVLSCGIYARWECD